MGRRFPWSKTSSWFSLFPFSTHSHATNTIFGNFERTNEPKHKLKLETSRYWAKRFEREMEREGRTCLLKIYTNANGIKINIFILCTLCAPHGVLVHRERTSERRMSRNFRAAATILIMHLHSIIMNSWCLLHITNLSLVSRKSACIACWQLTTSRTLECKQHHRHRMHFTASVCVAHARQSCKIHRSSTCFRLAFSSIHSLIRRFFSLSTLFVSCVNVKCMHCEYTRCQLRRNKHNDSRFDSEATPRCLTTT